MSHHLRVVHHRDCRGVRPLRRRLAHERPPQSQRQRLGPCRAGSGCVEQRAPRATLLRALLRRRGLQVPEHLKACRGHVHGPPGGAACMSAAVRSHRTRPSLCGWNRWSCSLPSVTVPRLPRASCLSSSRSSAWHSSQPKRGNCSGRPEGRLQYCKPSQSLPASKRSTVPKSRVEMIVTQVSFRFALDDLLVNFSFLWTLFASNK